MRSLSVSVGWFLGHRGLHIETVDLSSWQERQDLPREAVRFYGRLADWAELAGEHYVWVDQLDVTAGWHDEDVRRAFVADARELERDLVHALGNGWHVDVSPEPGLTCVSLAGEYGCDWPLWVATGQSGPDDWPMLSPAMADRLRAWAAQADPDHYPPPDPVMTERLRRDLARELGARFRVRA